eukprot:3186197-Pyramimonas_sp.AAC.1
MLDPRPGAIPTPAGARGPRSCPREVTSADASCSDATDRRAARTTLRKASSEIRPARKSRT